MLICLQHSLPLNLRSILIIQLGDIGDVVWAIPAIWAVKDAYPQAKVSILLREGNGSLLEAESSLHKIFEVKSHHESGFFSKALDNLNFIKKLRHEHFSVVFDLRADERGAFNAYLTGAPFRAAMFYQDVPFWRNRLFTHLVVTPPLTGERVLGAAEQSLKIVRAFGIREKTSIPRLHVADDVMERVQRLLVEEKIANPGKWVSINPFSRWGYKEWRYDKWISLMDWLWDEYAIATVIVGSEEEKNKAHEIGLACQGMVYNLAGKTTLAELAGLLSFSRLHIGVDSAAPHIAAAVGTATVTIYGPSDWHDWAPIGDQHRIIIPQMNCVPCRNKGCEGREKSKCLEELTVDQVQNVVREALADMKGMTL